MKLSVIAAPLVALAAIGLAVTARGEEPAASGQQLFQQRCAACHDERGFGTRVLSRRVSVGQAELEVRDNLPAAYVTAVVRNGLGSMPQIRAEELTDAQLALIAAYLEEGPQ